MGEFLKSNIVGIVIYVIIIVVLIFILIMEYKDINCKAGGGQCGKGWGRAYSAGRPEKDDNFKTLLEKAKSTSRYEINSIFWRRAFIAAIISAFLILFILKSKCPSGITLGYSFLIIYIVMYLTFTLFQQWVTKPALKQMEQILEQLKKKYESKH